MTANQVLGGAFIAVFAAGRFNTPATNRSTTTAVRYHLAAGAYCALSVAAYGALLASFANLPKEWLKFVPEIVRELSPAFSLALLMTVLLPGLPIIGELDEWTRKHLEAMAAIPFEARRISALLRRARFVMPAERLLEVKRELTGLGCQADGVAPEVEDTPYYLWMKATALILQLDEWEADRHFAAFVSRFGPALQDLKRTYQRLQKRAVNCFRWRHELELAGDRKVEPLSQYCNDFVEQCTDLLNDTYTFMSRGLLQCELTYASRSDRLKAMGFDVEIARPRLTLNQLLSLFGIVAVVMLLGFLLSDVPTERALAKTTMIAIIYSVAIACSVVPKDKWDFARRMPGDVRPAAFYLVAALAAGALSVTISIVCHVLFFDGAAAGWARRPWALMSFVTALTVAALADDLPTPALPAGRLRWIEGAVQCLMSMLATVVVIRWLHETLPPKEVPNLFQVLPMSATIGFLVGFLVPTWYREAPRERDVTSAEERSDIVPSLRAAGKVDPGRERAFVERQS